MLIKVDYRHYSLFVEHILVHINDPKLVYLFPSFIKGILRKKFNDLKYDQNMQIMFTNRLYFEYLFVLHPMIDLNQHSLGWTITILFCNQ